MGCRVVLEYQVLKLVAGTTLLEPDTELEEELEVLQHIVSPHSWASKTSVKQVAPIKYLELDSELAKEQDGIQHERSPHCWDFKTMAKQKV